MLKDIRAGVFEDSDLLGCLTFKRLEDFNLTP